MTIKSVIGLLTLVGAWAGIPHDGLAGMAQQYSYEVDGKRYPYAVESTGENYTFEFETNPGREGGQLKAALHVMGSIYGDTSIANKYSEVFPKEGAKCYVFEAAYYSYRACFLPNDYSPDKKNRFWGFVSRLPNAMWFVTRQIIPAVLILTVVIWIFRRP